MKKLMVSIILTVGLMSSCNNKINLYEHEYYETYKEFLLNYDIDENEAFPVCRFSLVDLNFDKIPEIAVLHHSGASIGGYYTYYYFDGKNIVALTKDDDSRLWDSHYVQLLADNKNKKVYLLKEMFLLKSNENGTYGYLREMINHDGKLYAHDILSLLVDENVLLEKNYAENHHEEYDFLTNDTLHDCLITKYNIDNTWKQITPMEYLNLKQELIPEENNYEDLFDNEIYHHLNNTTKFSGQDYISMTEEDIEQLFLRWFEKF